MGGGRRSGPVTGGEKRAGSGTGSFLATGLIAAFAGPGGFGEPGTPSAAEASCAPSRGAVDEALRSEDGPCFKNELHAGTTPRYTPAPMIVIHWQRIVRDLARTDVSQRGRTIATPPDRVKGGWVNLLIMRKCHKA